MSEVLQNSISSRDGQTFVFDTFDKVKTVFESQIANRQNVKNRSAEERKDKLNLLNNEILKHRTEIEEALFKDLKKHKIEAGYSEIFPTLSEIRNISRNLRRWMRSNPVKNSLPFIGSKSKILLEPKGNCLIITPWNYPFYLSMTHLAVCIASGNVAILKTSEYSPNVSKVIKEILSGVFEEDEVAVIFTGAEVSTEMPKLPFDHIHFTGSTNVGKQIMKNASTNLTSVTLELGGKSPVIIDENYPIKDCIKQIGWGKFLNAGQTCIAPDYILVHKDKKDEFVDKLSTYLKDSFGEKSTDSEFLTGIVNKSHFKRIENLVQDAVSDGNQIVFGGKMDESRLAFGPTLLMMNSSAAIMEEEIFGPVLPIVLYNDVEDAIKFINKKHKPLAMYLFSNDKKWLNEVLLNTSSGGVCINDTMAHFVQTYLPMGGVNHSGIGKSHGYIRFKEFSNERAVLKSYIKARITWPFQFPYTKLKKNILEILIKYF